MVSIIVRPLNKKTQSFSTLGFCFLTSIHLKSEIKNIFIQYTQ